MRVLEDPGKLKLPLETGDGRIILLQTLVGLTEKVIGLKLERLVKVV